MKIVRQKVVIQSKVNRDQVLKKIEAIGRTCYKSEAKITPDSASEFASMLVWRGHLSVLEHVSLTVRFVTDRGISHELVRHRIASFSQESTRYVDYGSPGRDVEVIIPGDLAQNSSPGRTEWETAVARAEEAYLNLRRMGYSPQLARSVLPTCAKTEVVMTADLREWMLVLDQRTSEAAHPDMRRLMRPLLRYLRLQLPEIFTPGLGSGAVLAPEAEFEHHKGDSLAQMVTLGAERAARAPGEGGLQ